MTDTDIYLSLGTEHLFSSLFGKRRTHGMVGWTRISAWRRECRRLVRALERYIRANVVTDRDHQSSIDATLSSLHHAIDGPGGERETEMIGQLSRLCLLLVGAVPDHWRRRVVNRPKYYVLTRCRSVHYSQSPAQMAALIWERHVYQRLNRQTPDPPRLRALDTTYWRLRRAARDAEFVALFRKQHPQEYLKLFA